MARKKTNEQYVQELVDKNIGHIPLEVYVNNATPILHKCIKGHEWKVKPNHVLSKSGCPKCSVTATKSTEQYIKDLLDKGIGHTVGEPYRGAKIAILHYCKEGHAWHPTPDKVLSGNGCPSCAEYGFNPSKPAILYYIKVVSYHKEVYYKIGITNRTIEDRFSNDKDKSIQVLMKKEFDIGADARLEEQSILNKYKDKRVTVFNFLKSGGNTELFEIDILGLDA